MHCCFLVTTGLVTTVNTGILVNAIGNSIHSELSGDNAAIQHGITSSVSGNRVNKQYGFSSTVVGDGGSKQYGYYSSINGEAQEQYGIYSETYGGGKKWSGYFKNGQFELNNSVFVVGGDNNINVSTPPTPYQLNRALSINCGRSSLS